MKELKRVTVNLKERSYDILIGSNQLDHLPEILKKLDIGNYAVIITNPKIKKLFKDRITRLLKKISLGSNFIQVPDSERSKSIKYLISTVSRISKLDIKKRVFIIALGGGVIGDLAGFVASVYKRGIPYIQIPTTLLAQVDSSIGGKVAVDLDCGKNLLGAFYQPRLVFSDISLLSSLNQRQILSGLSEIIKYGVISDKELFDYIKHNYYKILELDEKVLIYIISQSAKIKARIVSDDEKEQKGMRTILNFGHTIGHAIEAASGYSKRYTHGEAIAFGMVCATDLAHSLNICSSKTLSQLESLISRVGLPVYIKDLPLNRIMKAYLYDKKFISGKNRFVLPLKIGKVDIFEDIPEDRIKEVIKRRIKRK